MKKAILAVVLTAALAFAVAASALTMSGLVTGTGHSGALVTIYSYQNGSGSTHADVNGVYSFGGIVSGQIYYLSAQSCANHVQYYSPQKQYVGGGSVPNLPLSSTGTC